MKFFPEKWDRCLKEIPQNQPKYYFHFLDDLLKSQIKEKSQNREDYLLCSFCHLIYEQEKFKQTVNNLRKTKCFICQNILLKEKKLATLYYSVIEVDPNDKEGDREIEKPICLNCWNINKADYWDKYWLEMVVNPRVIMGFEKEEKRRVELRLN